jgi:hypothetical protein
MTTIASERRLSGSLDARRLAVCSISGPSHTRRITDRLLSPARRLIMVQALIDCVRPLGGFLYHYGQRRRSSSLPIERYWSSSSLSSGQLPPLRSRSACAW